MPETENKINTELPYIKIIFGVKIPTKIAAEFRNKNLIELLTEKIHKKTFKDEGYGEAYLRTYVEHPFTFSYLYNNSNDNYMYIVHRDLIIKTTNPSEFKYFDAEKVVDATVKIGNICELLGLENLEPKVYFGLCYFPDDLTKEENKPSEKTKELYDVVLQQNSAFQMLAAGMLQYSQLNFKNLTKQNAKYSLQVGIQKSQDKEDKKIIVIDFSNDEMKAKFYVTNKTIKLGGYEIVNKTTS